MTTINKKSAKRAHAKAPAAPPKKQRASESPGAALTPAVETKSQTTKKPKKAQPTSTKPKSLSALDAAAKVLSEANSALSTGEMIEQMASKGYWKSPGGLTPASTLYSAILRELKSKGKAARFAKAERGKFILKK